VPEGPLELLLPALVRLGLVDLYNEAKAGRGTLVAQLEQLAVRELELLAVVAAEEDVVTGEKVKAGPEVLDKRLASLGAEEGEQTSLASWLQTLAALPGGPLNSSCCIFMNDLAL
jgi:hypothetical protein